MQGCSGHQECARVPWTKTFPCSPAARRGGLGTAQHVTALLGAGATYGHLWLQGAGAPKGVSTGQKCGLSLGALKSTAPHLIGLPMGCPAPSDSWDRETKQRIEPMLPKPPPAPPSTGPTEGQGIKFKGISWDETSLHLQSRHCPAPHQAPAPATESLLFSIGGHNPPFSGGQSPDVTPEMPLTGDEPTEPVSAEALLGTAFGFLTLQGYSH